MKGEGNEEGRGKRDRKKGGGVTWSKEAEELRMKEDGRCSSVG